MRVLLLVLAGLLPGPMVLAQTAAPARDELRVLPALVDGVAPEMLVEAQLKKLAYAALDRRDAAYEQLKTPEDLAAWQKNGSGKTSSPPSAVFPSACR